MKLWTRKDLLLLTLGLMTACGTVAPRTGVPATPDYVLEVSLEHRATLAALTDDYGAVLLSENPETGTALLGLTEAQASAYNAVLRPSSGAMKAEANRDTFSGGAISATMSGTRSVWATGDLRTWSGGTRSVWATGIYAPVPENSATFRQIRLEFAQVLAPKLGSGIKVAIIDTGIDISHPAFFGMLAPSNEWRDFVDGDAWPTESGALGEGGFGHGTAVAGLIAQVAPNVTLLPLRVLGPDGSGDTANVAQAIDWAVARGARVINLSLGSTERSNLVQDAIKRAKDRKVFVVSSVGNENLKALTYPAADADGASGEYALSVGSVNSMDLKSSFSNFHKDLEVVAPGEGLFTTGPGGLLLSWSGTSMSAPLVTGSISLALGQTINVDSKDVTKKLAENATDIYRNGMNSIYKDLLGIKGRLDIEKFLKSVGL